MFHAARHDMKVAGPQRRFAAVAITQDERPTPDEEEFVLVGMAVPDEFSLHLRELHVLAVAKATTRGDQYSVMAANSASRLPTFSIRQILGRQAWRARPLVTLSTSRRDACRARPTRSSRSVGTARTAARLSTSLPV